MRSTAIIAIALAFVLTAAAGFGVYTFFGGADSDDDSDDSAIDGVGMKGPLGTTNKNEDKKPAQPDGGDGGDGGDDETDENDTDDVEPYQILSWFPWDNPASMATGDVEVDVGGFNFKFNINQFGCIRDSVEDPKDFDPEAPCDADDVHESLASSYEYDESWGSLQVCPSTSASLTTVGAWNLTKSQLEAYLKEDGDAFGPGEAWSAYRQGSPLPIREINATPIKLFFGNDHDDGCTKVDDTQMWMTVWLPVDKGQVAKGYWPMVKLVWEHADGRSGEWSYYDPEVPAPILETVPDPVQDVVDDPEREVKSNANELTTACEEGSELSALCLNGVQDTNIEQTFTLPLFVGDDLGPVPEVHVVSALFFVESYLDFPAPGDDLTSFFTAGGFIMDDAGVIKTKSEEKMGPLPTPPGIPGRPGTSSIPLPEGGEEGDYAIACDEEVPTIGTGITGTAFVFIFGGCWISHSEQQDGTVESFDIQFSPGLPAPQYVRVAIERQSELNDYGATVDGSRIAAGSHGIEVILSLESINEDVQRPFQELCDEQAAVSTVCDPIYGAPDAESDE